MNEGQFLQDVFTPAGRYYKLWPLRYLRWVGLNTLVEKGHRGPGRFAFDAGVHLTALNKLAGLASTLRGSSR